MRIDRQHEHVVRSAGTHAELADVLQRAIKLEHATLQPYLTAIYSLKRGTNAEVEQHIRWVAMEEMLHMCILGNLINALGGTPVIDRSDFVPTFPGPLPMGIGDDLEVHLEPYGVEQVRNCFMVIEQPDDPIEIDTEDVPDLRSTSTIGGFYRGVRAKLVELGGPLPGNPARQVRSLQPYGDDELFGIDTVDDAVRAVDVIVRQGEGSSTKPTDPDGGMAHFYRFQELVAGRRLVKDTDAPEGYSFTGEEIPFDPDGVWPLEPNTRTADLPEGSEARERAEAFAHGYRQMLRLLHHAFDGHPDTIEAAVKQMQGLQALAYTLVETPFPGRDGRHVGPTFEWRD